jgi:hypothetical protein
LDVEIFVCHAETSMPKDRCATAELVHPSQAAIAKTTTESRRGDRAGRTDWKLWGVELHMNSLFS